MNAQTNILDEIIVDCFAGGGGWSTGIEQATGAPVDIAINHDPDAILMHKTNHPYTEHYCENIYVVDPRKAVRGRPVGWAHFSPDCKHFSKAKGGKPVEKKIRGLAWVVLRWAGLVRPRIISIENVEEFLTWGPVRRGRPVKSRKGETFLKFVAQLEALGYVVEWKELRACDTGAPTTRKRLFVIARCDGQPIVWPEPTHGDPKSAEVQSGKLKPWRTAAEIIDWTLPCPSIFERKKPLAENTMKRIARGIEKFVLNNPDPFIVKFQQNSVGQDLGRPLDTVMPGAARFGVVNPYIVQVNHSGDRFRGQALQDPLQTITAKHGYGVVTPVMTAIGQTGFSTDRSYPTDAPVRTVVSKAEQCIVTPTLIQTGYGEKKGQLPRVPGLEKPLGTVVSTEKHAVIALTLVQYHGEKTEKEHRGQKMEDPILTVDGSNRYGLVSASLVSFQNGQDGRPPEEPLNTITTKEKSGMVAAYLAKHYGGNYTGPGSGAHDPVHTITEHDHNALVTAFVSKQKGTNIGQDAESPLQTITAGGKHFAEVRAFLIKYYGTGAGQDLNAPLHTVTTDDRFGLVSIHGIDYQIVDIGMRMLSPRELYCAQGFPPDYVIDHDYTGKAYPKSKQVARCGNAVPPPFARALVRANWPEKCKGVKIETMAQLNKHIAV
ncbi:MAG: DNA cytosine methyltransferase [Oscillospiraceae bacterium]